MKHTHLPLFLIASILLVLTPFSFASPIVFFEEGFSSDHPFSTIWNASYQGTPFSENLTDDIQTDNDSLITVDDFYMSVTDNAFAFTSVNASLYNNITLSYTRRLYRSNGSNVSATYMFHVDYRLNSSQPWISLETSDNETWESVSWNLPSFVDNGDDLQMRFYFEGATNDTATYFLVDSIALVGFNVTINNSNMSQGGGNMSGNMTGNESNMSQGGGNMSGNTTDTHGPNITMITREPFYPMCTDNVTVCAKVVDESEILEVLLHSKTEINGTETYVAMQLLNGTNDTYCGSRFTTEYNITHGLWAKYEVIATDIHNNTNYEGGDSFQYDCRNPDISISCDVTSGNAPLTVNCTAVGNDSVYPIGITYNWSTGSNTTSTQMTYISAGTFNLSVTATDLAGNHNTTVQEIIVSSGSSSNNAGSGSGTTIISSAGGGGGGSGSSRPIINLSQSDEPLFTPFIGDGRNPQPEETPEEENNGFFSFITGNVIGSGDNAVDGLGLIFMVLIGLFLLYLLVRL